MQDSLILYSEPRKAMPYQFDPDICYCTDYEYSLRIEALTPFARIPYVVAGSTACPCVRSG